LTEKARELSHKLHAGQLRDDGKPYTTHTDKVAEILSLVTNDPDIISAGYLHDSIEDKKISEKELRNIMGDRITNIVLEVTKEGTNCFPHLKSREAYLVKFADRLQNLSDMQGWESKKQQTYMDKSVFWKK
jgi:(p)ppGpp synthase/HD superfamily hydrolase